MQMLYNNYTYIVILLFFEISLEAQLGLQTDLEARVKIFEEYLKCILKATFCWAIESCKKARKVFCSV